MEKQLRILQTLVLLSIVLLAAYEIIVLVIFFISMPLGMALPKEMWDTFLGYLLYLAGMTILFACNGKSRKFWVAAYYLFYFAYYVLMYAITHSMGKPMELDSVKIIQFICAWAMTVSCLLYFFYLVSNARTLKSIIRIFFIITMIGIAFNICYGVFIALQSGAGILLGMVTSNLPVFVLSFIQYKSLEESFFSSFIAENPKYFLPKKHITADRVRIISMFALGGFYILLFIIFGSGN